MTVETTYGVEPIENAKRPLYQKIAVVALLMSVICGTLTGIMTHMNAGDSDAFLTAWIPSFVIALLLVMPMGMLFMSLTEKLIRTIVPRAKDIYQNLLIGILGAFIIESIMASSTAANSVGFDNSDVFLATWSQNFIAVIPAGLVIATIMSLFIRPKLKSFIAS